MPRKEFESFTRLDASDVNTFLMDQTVQSFADSTARASAITTPVEGMVTYLNDIDSLSVYNGTDWTIDRTIQVFGGTAARGSAIPSPVEGMYTHINDTDSLEYYDGSAWVAAGGGGAILQVVSTTLTDVFTGSLLTGTVTALTGLTASITPSSTSSKILVLASITSGSSDNRTGLKFILKRDSTSIALGDAASSRTRATSGSFGGAAGVGEFAESVNTISVNHLDSPSSTSSITYGFDVGHGLASTATVYVNRSISDGNFAYIARYVSTITLMEVAG
jgi:hypothetical protein